MKINFIIIVVLIQVTFQSKIPNILNIYLSNNGVKKNIIKEGNL